MTLGDRPLTTRHPSRSDERGARTQVSSLTSQGATRDGRHEMSRPASAITLLYESRLVIYFWHQPPSPTSMNTRLYLLIPGILLLVVPPALMTGPLDGVADALSRTKHLSTVTVIFLVLGFFVTAGGETIRLLSAKKGLMSSVTSGLTCSAALTALALAATAAIFFARNPLSS